MLEPIEWAMVLRPIVPTIHAKKVVAENVRETLATLEHGVSISTNDLIEALYPREEADKSLAGDEARMRLYKLVAILALSDLADCATRGELSGKKFMGRPVRPWMWHRPKVREMCCLCGQLLPEDKT